MNNLENKSKTELRNIIIEQNNEINSLKRSKRLYKYHYLTNMKQRHDFEHDLRQKFSNKESFSLVMIDVNDLHTVNRTSGYAAGDALLIQVANDIKMISEDCGEGYHCGGDEFYIICYNNEVDYELFNFENSTTSCESSSNYSHPNELLDAVDKGIIEKKKLLKRRNNDRL